MIYYVYLHIRLNDGLPFYVGKGSYRRAFIKRGRSNHWKRIVDKHNYDVVYLEESLTEQEAHDLEKYWIKRIGRMDLGTGPLCNFTDGGEGTSGKVVSSGTREAVSRSNKIRTKSILQSAVIGARYRGKFGASHNRSKAILDTSTGAIFGSISEASRFLNKSISSIHYQVGKRFQTVKP